MGWVWSYSSCSGIIVAVGKRPEDLNYLSHYLLTQSEGRLPSEQRAWFVAGVMVPDLWPAFRRRPRLDPSLLSAAGQEPDSPQVSALRAGLLEHMRSDEAFHASLAFNTWRRSAVPAAAAVVERPSLQSFLAHIGVELTLDRLLTLDDPALGEVWYELLAQVDEVALERALGVILGPAATGFGVVFGRFRDARHLLGYARREAVAGSLERIVSLLRRPSSLNREGLVPFVEQVEQVLQTGPWPPLEPARWVSVAC